MSQSQEKYPRKVTKSFDYIFSVSQDGLYAITLIARCQSGKQMGLSGGEDLQIEIDGLKFREVPALVRAQYQNIPPAWNGTQLKGLSKTATFLLWLHQGKHTIKFIPRQGAIIEKEPFIEYFTESSHLEFNIESQAEDGDRRPWHTFALINLPLKIFSADITVRWRGRDSDDIKLIIDNKIKKNNLSLFHRNWLWSGSIFKKLLQKERQEKIFQENLGKGVHYIEFWADRTPTLHKVILDLGQIDFKRIPTVDDPKWTGDFHDDTKQMILARAIFGEARDERLSEQARIAVGWSIRNRVEDSNSRWSNTYHQVILQEKQYSAFNLDDNNRRFVEDPLYRNNQIDGRAWLQCYEIAGRVINGEAGDLTDGANHHYDESIAKPYWATDDTFKIKIDTIYFHRL